MSKRLEKSLQLLKTGQISIKDIAYQSGFNSVAYFSKCFRSFYGYSPSIVKRNQAII
jgi:transcriptional regulator GlxA family with amidase domain